MNIVRKIKTVCFRLFKYAIIIRLWFIIKKKPFVRIDNELSPIWILGMFRSGTSLTTQIISNLGVDLGPSSHQLRAIGQLRNLNPNGFYENFIFAEISRYYLFINHRQGDNPLTNDEINVLNWNQINRFQLIKYSLFKVNEDRISLKEKYTAYKIIASSNLNKYLLNYFKAPLAIKIPMLSFIYPLLLEAWPNSRFLIVFRNPTSTIKSSAILTNKASFQLYNAYYSTLLNLYEKASKKSFLFSYDHLIKNPNESISSLIHYLGLTNKADIDEICRIIDIKLVRNIPTDKEIPAKTNSIYNRLLRLAINV